jgi:hypothetical protein
MKNGDVDVIITKNRREGKRKVITEAPGWYCLYFDGRSNTGIPACVQRARTRMSVLTKVAVPGGGEGVDGAGPIDQFPAARVGDDPADLRSARRNGSSPPPRP